MPILDKASPSDLPSLARFIQLAFGVTPESAAEWLDGKLRLENLRVLRGPDGPLAGLGRIPMAQFYGGRSVPMLGIAGVATPPEHRGRGFAKQLMTAVVREAAEDGFPLSVLYASTQPLYRSVGYEQAGYRVVSKLPMQTLGVIERDRDVVSLSDADAGAVHDCYRDFARPFPGMVDRSEYIWDRVRNRRGDRFHGFGIREGGQIAGYLYAHMDKPGRDRGDLSISDVAWRTPGAARKLLGLLADFTTMAEHALISGAPLHPLAMLLPQQRFELAAKEYWFLRVLRIKDAVERRGYSPGIATSMVFDIADDCLPANTGRWKVSVSEGVATCRPDTSSEPAIACSIAAFAPLYTGLLTCSQALGLGFIRAEPAVARSADAIFACGTPWMVDFF